MHNKASLMEKYNFNYINVNVFDIFLTFSFRQKERHDTTALTYIQLSREVTKTSINLLRHSHQ